MRLTRLCRRLVIPLIACSGIVHLSISSCTAAEQTVDESLSDTDWWSLQPIERPEFPQLEDTDESWVRTPVDKFIVNKLREQGLSPSPEADRRTLIRRLYFDLIGLPPTLEEIESFVGDSNPQAYEQLVERLLASPRHGERWARHWLDVVHYGDTHGFDKDKVRNHAWPYRDYVIRAFNKDLPYDRFVREQLAGDYFYPEDDDGIIALGFIAAGPFDWVGQIEVGEGTNEKKRIRNLDRDDMVRTTIETFCSITVGCARCHDHKFDPFTSEDYYSLQAVFADVDRADRPYAVDPQVESLRAALQAQKKETETSLAKVKNESSLADQTADQEVQEVQAKAQDKLNSSLASIQEQLASLPPQQLVFAAASSFPRQGQFAATDGKPRPVYLLERGNVLSPLDEVGPGTIGCLPHLDSRFETIDATLEGARRAALADWILDRQNPLPWRSIVNRIWHYHFGRGIVDTPNDLGHMGAPPSHPELLNWLAAEFRDGNRSLKDLHRLLVNSATYRQSSRHHPQQAQRDGSNRYLWRMNPRRLEAESIRDAVLATSGQLDLSMYGPGFRTFGFEDDHSPRYKYEEYNPDEPSSHRRSVYRFIVRSAPDPFMETLDCADPSTIVPKRNETLTPLQSLAMLNNRFMVRMAEVFAERVRASARTTESRIAQAMRLALGRTPTPTETRLLTTLANEHGLPSACRLIFNTNEFVFVD